jgi:Rhodopirellula transposase DDE domain
MISRTQAQAIQAQSEVLKPELDERARRLWAATEAHRLGHGGVATGARATGLAESTVRLGTQELTCPAKSTAGPRRLRRPGAGRQPVAAQDQRRLKALALVEPTTRGDPMSPLRWTCKSTRRLAKALGPQGHHVSHSTVGHLLKALQYRLPSPRKTREGTSPPARNAQVASSTARGNDFQHRGQPVVSVETTKKEVVGDFAKSGRESHPQGAPAQVRGHDFVDKRWGKAMPSGVYDMTHNCGGVRVGVAHDPAELAGASGQQGWQRRGQRLYPHAQHVLMTADGGGSHGRRSRVWKGALHTLSDATGLEVRVCHVPPGTSKWHKSAHRLCCHLTEHWRGRPLVSHEVIVNLMAKTTTEAGLRVEAALDPALYETGKKVSDDQLAQINIYPADVHGTDGNDVIKPTGTKR